jgi:type II secretory pathway pseudopilin PulG
MLDSKIRSSSGMTLVEMLVFVAIISVALITLLGISITMTRQMRTNYNKIYATHYADDALEWMRVQKNVVGWQTFYETVAIVASQTEPNISRVFCANSPLTSSTEFDDYFATPAECDEYSGVTDVSNSPKIFKRQIAVEQVCSEVLPCDSSRALNVSVEVSWTDAGGKIYNVETNTVYAPL